MKKRSCKWPTKVAKRKNGQTIAFRKPHLFCLNGTKHPCKSEWITTVTHTEKRERERRSYHLYRTQQTKDIFKLLSNRWLCKLHEWFHIVGLNVTRCWKLCIVHGTVEDKHAHSGNGNVCGICIKPFRFTNR